MLALLVASGLKHRFWGSDFLSVLFYAPGILSVSVLGIIGIRIWEPQLGIINYYVANVLGVLSLIVWSLIVVVTLKYIVLLLRMDNNGEGGTLALTKSLARQLAPHGVLVNAICPGSANTDMPRRHRSEEEVMARLRATPLGHVLEPENIAGPILFLASDAAAYITGQSYNINCGTDDLNCWRSLVAAHSTENFTRRYLKF